jgi:endonuclease/exonuclease/phosphatase family metal-dependent hydrolase
MKALTYNILCGGDNRLTDENRRPLILSLLKDANPDIVALQEAIGFDDSDILQAFSCMSSDEI